MNRVLQKKGQFLCGEYVRLSREDGDKLESDSISNQKELISQFIKSQPDLKFADEYVDDGYSGTNFDRPGFKRLLEDAEQGKINCVIVKDLSRFGRNYIETGRYLEKIFPSMGIRFISVNDHYDSFDQNDDADSIIIPFKNLINDAYCRDISVKIRSQLDVKRKDGKFVGSFACYGYKKDPDDKNHLIVDPYAANNIKKIFRWRLDGMSSLTIAEHLNATGVLPPLEYKRSLGLNYNSGFRSGMDPKWNAVSVNRILTNEMYTGVMVQGKRKKLNYKLRQCQDVDKDSWIKVSGTQDAIISTQIFNDTQTLLKKDTRTAPEQETIYLFSGFLKCGSCGQNMVRRCVTRAGKKYYYYHCSTYKNGEGCTSHNISEKKLEKAVLDGIRTQVGLLAEASELEGIIQKSSDLNFALKDLDRQIMKLTEEADHYQDLKNGLYEDLCDDIISLEEYQDLKKEFSRKIGDADKKRKRLEKKRIEVSSRDPQEFSWLSGLLEYKDIDSLNRRVLTALVEEIIVYDRERIEIHFRYEDEMKILLQGLEDYKKSNTREISV